MSVIYADVIIKPMLTEKSMGMQGQNNVFVFKVKKSANKLLVKQAVQNLFEVEVEKVNIVNYAPKSKRVGRYLGKTSGYKKAYVKLKPGQMIGEKPQETKEDVKKKPVKEKK